MRVGGCLLALFIILSLQSHAWASENVRSFNLLTLSSQGVTISHPAGNKNLHELLTAVGAYDDADRYKAAKRGTRFTVTLGGTEIALNDEGRKALLLSYECGSHACGLALFDRKTLRSLGDFEGGDTVTIHFQELRKGSPKICEKGCGGTPAVDCFPIYVTCYEYFGKIYQRVSQGWYGPNSEDDSKTEWYRPGTQEVIRRVTKKVQSEPISGTEIVVEELRNGRLVTVSRSFQPHKGPSAGDKP